MHRHRDGQELSPEALRQLGAAFAAAGAGFDPGLAMAAWKLLSSGDRARAQIGDPSVLGTLQRAAEEQIKIAKQTQAQTGGNIHGVMSDATGQGFHLEQPRGRPGGLWDQLAGRASSERGSPSGSSERYAEAGMSASLSGNADIRGVTMANYYTSPITRAMVDTGVNYGTFNYLRDQGFTGNNIASAAHDARALGFSANDQRMLGNHAIIRQKGNAPDKTNLYIQKFSKALDKNDKFRDAALELKNAKTPEEKAAAEAKIKKISDGLADKHGVTKDMADQRDKAVSKAIDEIKDRKVDDKVKEIHGVTLGLGTVAERESPTLTGNADALLNAAEAKLAAKKAAQTANPTASAPKGGAPTPSNPAGAAPQSSPPRSPSPATAPALPKPTGPSR